MAFIDILGSQLFALGFAGLIILYMTVQSYFLFRKGKRAEEIIKAGTIPLAAIGVYMFLSGLYGQFTWPLPGSYNVLFYDIYPLVGLLFIGAAATIYLKMKLQYIGFYGLLLGIMAMWYGAFGYSLKLTTEPLALLGLYTLFGVGGILGYPVMVMLDRAQAGIKNRSYLWYLLIYLFWITLLIGSILALVIGTSAIPSHLAGG
jgi:putative membrane protein